MSSFTESKAREAIALRGAALMRAGLTPGTSGNISVRLGDGFLVTPTNSRLGELDPADIAKVDFAGNHLSGMKPSKEAFLHLKMLDMRPVDEAVVHLHSTHAVAISCMDGLDYHDVLPKLTAYYAMKVGAMPRAPYFAPGDLKLADAVAELAEKHHAILLSNHGPVASGTSLDAAVGAIEEIEETSKLFLLLRGSNVRLLSAGELAELQSRFPS